MALKTDGQPFTAGEIQPKTIDMKTLFFYTAKATGYVYWLAGAVVVNGVEYSLSAGNSGASQTDKLITATLTDGANTASINFRATNYTITANSEVILGYVDTSSRLNMVSMPNQPNLAGYTFTKATATINVNGEGYFLSAYAYGIGMGFSSTPSAAASARIQVSIDSVSLYDTTDTHNGSGSTGAGAFGLVSVSGITKFNSNLTVTITKSSSAAGAGGSFNASYAEVLYLVK